MIGSSDRLYSSVSWIEAKKLNQPYLYLNDIETDGTHVCGYRKNVSGDFFLKSDLIPYIGFKEGDEVYVSDVSEESAVKNKNKRVFVIKVRKLNYCLESGVSAITSDYPILISWKYAVPIPPKIESMGMLLNDSLGSEVFKNKIVVGCQTISREKVEEVLENMKLLSQ